MIMTIEKKANGEHIFKGKEFTEEYDLSNKILKRMAFEKVNEAFRDFETTWGREFDEQDNIYDEVSGNYTIDEGDYAYTVSIKTKSDLKIH